MRSAPFELPHNDDANPLNMVEDLAHSKGWKFTRHDDDLMTIMVPGQKVEYEVCLEWQDEFSSLLFACSLPLEIAEAHYEIAARTLEQINQNLWMGHFDLSNQNIYPTYRHTLLCRMLPVGISIDMIADVFDIAVAECNRFYTTFQLVQAGDVRLQDNLHAAVFETIGEA
jgi:hypothetical protein